MNSGLDTFDDLLDICTYGNKMDIVLIFINIVSKYLLTLFIDVINVVNDDELLFPVDYAARLAKRFHFIAKILYSLLLQVIDEHNIVLRKRSGFFQLIIFADQRV
jgi:hypothetical protein